MKSKIYTVTLNPAIDYIMHPESLRLGSINRSGEEAVYFGGKGINVSLVLKELGVESVATGFTAGFTGKALEEGIGAKGIKTDFVRLEKGLTRINVKLRTEAETDINGNGPEISKKDLNRLYSKLNCLRENDILILSGSVPKCLPDDIYERIMERTSRFGVKFVVDASGDLLLKSLKYKPFMIKPNNDELGEIFGDIIDAPEKATGYALKLKEAGAVNVLVSMGDRGAVLVDEHCDRHFLKPYKGKTVNTVGAGDSMVAGFIAGYLKNGNYEYALKLGTASGSATAFSQGLASKEDIENLMKI